MLSGAQKDMLWRMRKELMDMLMPAISIGDDTILAVVVGSMRISFLPENGSVTTSSMQLL